MPLALLDNVPCSEMRGCNTHQGPRTAGNKSMLSYRADQGIPGCTKYTPGWASVPVCVRGSNTHTGRLPGGLEEATLTGRHCPADDANESEYRGSFKTNAAALMQQQQQHGSSAASLEALPATLVHYQTAQAHRGGAHVHYAAAPADSQQQLRRTGSALSATTAATSTGLLGYRTTSGSANRALQDTAAASATTRPLRPQSCYGMSSTTSSTTSSSGSGADAAGAERLRQLAAASMAPRFEGTSSYACNFGAMGGCGPLALATSEPRQQAALATTHELAAGTARSTAQPPGFTGFIPTAAATATHSPQATAQGLGLAPRPDAKHAMLPSALLQFQRTVAGCTLQQPRGGPAAASAALPAPTVETTQGFVNQQVARHSAQLRADHTHCIDSRKGTMSFFTGGGEYVSENGLADAQRYWVGRRPMGGRMKHA